jgi:APA family basic amino acid/polyamine antiporter
LTLVNVAGVRQSGLVQVVTTVLKFVPLLGLGIAGLFFIHGAHFTPFAPHGWGTGNGMIGGITAAAALTLWAFIGLESATVPAEEVREPKKTIPRATILGTLATTVVYVLATIAVMGVIPMSHLAGSTAPFADAARAMFGTGSFLGVTWEKLVALVALVSTFGCLNGWILIQGRIPLAASQDGLFPKRFGVVNGRSRTPVFGLVVSSVLVSGLMLVYSSKSLVDQFWNVILLATLTTLVPYAFAAASHLILMIREPDRFTGRSLVRDAAIALLGFGYAFWAMVGSGEKTIAWGFLLLMAGIPVYVFMRWRKQVELERQHAAELERMGVLTVDEAPDLPDMAGAVTRSEAMQ